MNTYKRLQDIAYDSLKKIILSGQFDYEIIYSETKTATALGISRTPVRNALLRLELEGYVSIFPSIGFKLKPAAAHPSITEITQIRAAIEGYAAYSLAEHIDTESAKKVLKELKKVFEKQANMLYSINHDSDSDLERFAECDNDFHKCIVAFCDNPAFFSFFNDYSYKMREYKKHFLVYPQRAIDTIKEHSYIIELIEKGDAQNVYDFVNLHVEVMPNIMLNDSSIDTDDNFGYDLFYEELRTENKNRLF